NALERRTYLHLRDDFCEDLLPPTHFYFFFQAEDGIRDDLVTGVQTCALPISWTRRARLAPGAHRLLSSQPNEPCSGGLGQGGRLTRRSSWTDLRPVTERAASAAVRRCCSVGTVPVRRATPFLTSTSMRASLSSGRLSSAFLTARSTRSSCAFTASCFDGGTTWSRFTTRFTPRALHAFSSAAALASADGTMPKSVTAPSWASTLTSRAGVRLSATRRSLVASVIHMSRAAATP